jgi:large subunit ribosomal protein L31
MKQEIHPEYQEVLFVDTSNGEKFLVGTTLKSDETETYEGKEYPMVRIPVSSASHPFFTGSQQFLDTEGRLERFKKRYARPSKKKEEDGEDGDES